MDVCMFLRASALVLQEKLDAANIANKTLEHQLDQQKVSVEVQLEHSNQKHQKRVIQLEQDKEEMLERVNKVCSLNSKCSYH